MNDFDKTFVLSFYNSFLKIELNCDKENIVLNKGSFQKNIFNLTCALICALKKCGLEDGFKDSCVLEIL